MKYLLIVALSIDISTAIPLGNEADNDGLPYNCKALMEGNGLTSSFPEVTAHVLHYITLQDIRYYFEPHASNEIMVSYFHMGV